MELKTPQLQNLAQKIGSGTELLETATVKEALAVARSLPISHSYHWLGGLETVFQNVEAEFGKRSVELLARYLLLVFLDDREWRPLCKVPDSIIEEMRQERGRIQAEVVSSSCGHYYPFTDAFYKDFSLLRGKSMPVYTGIVDTHCALWRHPLKFGALSQRLRFGCHLLRMPIGNKYYFQHHLHTSLLARFNQEGRLKTYKLVADLLSVNQDHKGFCGASWYYDPQLERISPRLAYLANDPLLNGAERFHLGADNSGNALAKSKTRNELYKKGKYLPQSYMLVWHRKAMIQWRDSAFSDQE
ncbi:hypothetical protein [Marinobacter nauticus]|uniref:Uncharacterized protein n=1 Tax=Marinobacter nauticus TaxID=2743 RepID=A0A1M2UZ04_MARNT|nr:hypothetical protein [Marinobacter nauticus]OJT00575.1 hypothetical protein BEE62_11080 [Marinobacter nauticus]